MRILFALPGLHRHNRGAEVAFIAIASELAKSGDSVTLIGSGQGLDETIYRFLHAASIPREHFESFPSMPVLRNEYVYEELSFVPGLLHHYKPAEYDITITCGYPFTNWVLRRPLMGGTRPPHVFVTQNGDWPARKLNCEYRFFRCDGLVCTNLEYYERHKTRWRSRFIPNGVDCSRFFPASAQRNDEFGLPQDRLIVLMVSALIPSKRVSFAIEAVSHITGAYLVVAGDGPLRQAIDTAAARLLPARYTRLSVAPERMAELYRSADVFLHLSKNEAFGNVYLEAMACGLPIVAHDSPQVRYIVGDDEFLVDTDDPFVIAEKIERARDAPAVEAERRFTRAAEFSWIKIAAEYRSFLREIVASSSKSES
jgi:glycosyltransferase involved in cell wall biosynthesis